MASLAVGLILEKVSIISAPQQLLAGSCLLSARMKSIKCAAGYLLNSLLISMRFVWIGTKLA
jgi:hypothetical protein